MPKKKLQQTPEQQAEQFTNAVRAMVAAGELNPTEADELFERAMGGVVKLRQQWFEGQPDSENPS